MEPMGCWFTKFCMWLMIYAFAFYVASFLHMIKNHLENIEDIIKDKNFEKGQK